MKTLKKDAGRESGEVQQRLDQAYAETPPKEIASGMTDTAESMRLGRNGAAKQQANEVLDQLQRLAKSLESTRKEYSQPQLREMMDLEEQLAMLEEEVKQNESPKQGAGDLQERSKKLESRLKRLASRDKKLAKALQEGDPAPNQASDTGPQIDAKDSLGWTLLGEYPRIRRATQALQTRIQEEILESSIMDADPNVPSAYKEMVEKYFKALSDDLR
jgi:DNA repair exonuclease SbcCD ATPase subunit